MYQRKHSSYLAVVWPPSRWHAFYLAKIRKMRYVDYQSRQDAVGVVLISRPFGTCHCHVHVLPWQLFALPISGEQLDRFWSCSSLLMAWSSVSCFSLICRVLWMNSTIIVDQPLVKLRSHVMGCQKLCFVVDRFLHHTPTNTYNISPIIYCRSHLYWRLASSIYRVNSSLQAFLKISSSS